VLINVPETKKRLVVILGHKWSDADLTDPVKLLALGDDYVERGNK